MTGTQGPGWPHAEPLNSERQAEPLNSERQAEPLSSEQIDPNLGSMKGTARSLNTSHEGDSNLDPFNGPSFGLHLQHFTCSTCMSRCMSRHYAEQKRTQVN